MDRKEIIRLNRVKSRIAEFQAEAEREKERGSKQDRFTLIMSELDIRKLDFLSARFAYKRVALARELLVSALYEAEEKLGLSGWEELTNFDNSSANHSIENIKTYAAYLNGLIDLDTALGFNNDGEEFSDFDIEDD